MMRRNAEADYFESTREWQQNKKGDGGEKFGMRFWRCYRELDFKSLQAGEAVVVEVFGLVVLEVKSLVGGVRDDTDKLKSLI